MPPTRRLVAEQLEERAVPATFGVPWPDAPRLTLSFAPDGTAAAGQSSVLFRTLNARLPTPTWQEEIVRAFQTWAAAANVGMTVVPDDGEAFGTLGLKEGDPRFGDIRIGAFPMAADTLAVADPYDPFIADTSVGDIYLNSSVDFSVGGGNGSYDLFSVLLHEAGHVLGLGGSSDPSSPMFERYAVHTGLTPGDAAALRALYGPKPAAAPPDGGTPRYVPPPPPGGTNPANPLAGAELLATTPGYVEHTYYQAVDEVSSAAPADAYRVVSPDLGGGLTNVMTVVVNSLGDGSVPLKALVYDAQGNSVGAAVIDDGGGHYEIQIRGVASASDYYVEVVPDGPGDWAWDARYELDVDFSMDARHLQTFVNDTLDAGVSADARSLHVIESQQFQFVLSATDWGAAAGAGARMAVFDAAGHEVFTLAAPSGASRFGEVFLSAGTYRVEFTRDPQPAAALTPVLFELDGLSQSDSLGPQVRDATLAPVEPSAAAAVPAPSFFWSLVGPAAPPAARPPSQSGVAGALTAMPLPLPAVQTSGPDARAVPSGGPAGSEALMPAPARTAVPVGVLPFGSGADAAAGPDDTAGARGLRERSAAPVSYVGFKMSEGSAPAETYGAALEGTQAIPEESAAALVAPRRQSPVRLAAAMRSDYVIWALAMGAGVLGWLKLRADEPVRQPLAALLQDALDRPFGAAHLPGDVSHLVPLDPQHQHLAVLRRQAVQGLLDGHLQDGVGRLVLLGGRLRQPVQGLAAGGQAHVPLGRVVVGALGPDLVQGDH